jgi:LEA14-like dessication related protein
MKRLAARLSLLVVALLCLTGCQRAPGPAVSLVAVHFRDATLWETTVVFTLRLENDQPEPVTLNGSAHDLYVNDLYVGKGLSGDALTLPRLSSTTNDVTVHLNNLALATRFKSVLETKRFDYRIASTFYGATWFGRTHSDSAGTLDLKDFTPTPPPAPTPPTTP